MEDIRDILFSGIANVTYIGVIVLFLFGKWRVYQKAGQPGWACIIPFYNVYILLKITGKPGWWLLLYLVPLVNIVISIIVIIELAKSFAKDGGFAVGLIFLPFIFYPILGLGKAEYIAPDGLVLIEANHDEMV